MRKLEAEVVQLEERARVLEKSIDELDFMDAMVRGEKMPDILDTRNPFYDEVMSKRKAGTD